MRYVAHGKSASLTPERARHMSADGRSPLPRFRSVHDPKLTVKNTGIHTDEVPSKARQGQVAAAPHGAPPRRRALLRTAVSDINMERIK